MREAREKKQAEGKVPLPKPQEPAPVLFPDLFWVWGVFCYLSDRRGLGPNGPAPISLEAMSAYLELKGRKHYPYVEQVLEFVPLLDREYLHTFYDNQSKEMEKMRRKNAPPPNPRRGLNR